MSGQYQDEHKSHSESLEGQAPTDDPQRQQAGNGGPTSHHEHGAPIHEDAPNPPRPHVHRRRRSSVSASAFVAAKSVQRLLSEVHLGVMRQPRAEEAPAYFRVEGIDYSRPDGVAADAVAAALTKKKLMLAGLSPKLIVIGLGLATSVLVNLVLVLTSLIESWKVSLVAGQVLPGNEPSSSAWWLAWASWLGIGATCTLAATCCVLLAPAARSSGIPGLLAYLNGAIAPKARNVLGNLVGPLDVYTLLAKFCSTILAVASGLFVGPEGPLIHMGAMLGHLVHTIKFTRGEKVIRKMTQGRVAPHLMLPIDAEQRRDFVALGAGAAIAAAFSAPIAGVLFVIEEAGTKVTPRLLEWAFVASAAAFFCDLVHRRHAVWRRPRQV